MRTHGNNYYLIDQTVPKHFMKITISFIAGYRDLCAIRVETSEICFQVAASYF